MDPPEPAGSGTRSGPVANPGTHIAPGRTDRMERFVQLIVGGGVGLVAGLWLLELSPTGSSAWLLGAALAVVGGGALAYGIGSELEWSRQ